MNKIIFCVTRFLTERRNEAKKQKLSKILSVLYLDHIFWQKKPRLPVKKYNWTNEYWPQACRRVSLDFIHELEIAVY